MVITGASRGIGLALATHFANAYTIVTCSRGDRTADITGGEHHSLDVTDERAVVALIMGLRQRYGRLDALINNAGIASMNHSLLTPLATVERIFRTNVLGTFAFCREGAKLMQRARSGRIVNIGSVATPLRLEGEAAYAASKAAVVSLTEVLAREFAPFGVTVNAVGPGPIRTDLLHGVPDSAIESLVQKQPLKRLAEMRDVINVVEFFLRPESDFITGQTVYLGGVVG
jgi:3-oxoacyl-[acyl-carrier protein] reductase